MRTMFSRLWQSLNITKNTTQKLFSLAFAIMFWIFVMDTENPEMVKVIGEVPVNLLGIEQLASKELQLVNEGPFTVDIKVRGRRKEVLTLSPSDFKVTVDVYQVSQGARSYQLSATVFKAGVIIEHLSQTELKLTFDQLINAKKPIQVELVGSVPEPFFVDDPSVSKALMNVSGPERLVNQITGLKGQIDVTGVTASFTTEIGLLPVDAQGKLVEGVTLEQGKVEVAVSVLMEKQVPIELVTVGEVGEGLKLDDLKLIPNAVYIIGDPNVINGITSIKTVPIDISQLKGTSTQPVVMELPKDVRLYPGEAVELTAVVEAMGSRIMTVDVDKINLMNAVPGQNVRFEESQLDLMISGPEGVLSKLVAEDVVVTLDILGLSAGKHQIPFVVTLPENLQWVQTEGATSRLVFTIEESVSGNE